MWELVVVVVGVSPILHSSKGVSPSRINTVYNPQARGDSQEDSEITNQWNDDLIMCGAVILVFRYKLLLIFPDIVQQT